MTDTLPADVAAPRRGTPRVRAWLEAVCWGAAVYPALAVVLLGLLAVTCYVRVGYWPSPYRPDPKDVAFPLQLEVTVTGVFLGLLGPLLFAPFFFLRREIGTDRIVAQKSAWAMAIAHVVCYAAWWIFVMAEPHHRLGEWMMD